MKKARKSGAVAAAGPGAAQGFVPEPALQPLSSGQPKLDCSEVGLDEDKELWLLQLPLEFPVGANVSWKIEEDPVDGFRGRCKVQGVEYMLVPEEEALSAQLYATPSSQHGSVAPVARRMTVVRTTEAPMLCFGQQPYEQQAAAVQPPTRIFSPADKKALKKKKGEQQQLAAAVAPVRAEPKGGAAPAAATKTGQAVPGAEGHPVMAVAGGTPAAAAGQQQGGEQEGKAAGKKRKEKEKGEKSDKKEKSAKKEKKDKSAKKEKKKDKS